MWKLVISNFSYLRMIFNCVINLFHLYFPILFLNLSRYLHANIVRLSSINTFSSLQDELKCTHRTFMNNSNNARQENKLFHNRLLNAVH